MKKIYTVLAALIIIAGGIISFTRSTPEQREAAYLKRGNALYDQGDYEKARLEYKNAARLFPADPDVMYHLGLVDETEGDYRNAYVNFTHAEQQNGHFYPALLKLANYYLGAEQYEQVQKRLDAVLQDSPDDPEAHALHAALLLRQNNTGAAESEARSVFESHPENITAISVLVGLYTAQKQADQATKMLEYGLARNPDSLTLLLLKAKVYEGLGNPAKLEEAYQAIIRLKPKAAEYRVYLANALVQAGKTDEAEAALRKGMEAQPDNASLRRELIAFLDKYRGTDQAEKEVEHDLSERPQDDEPRLWLVELYLSHNETDKAIKLLNEIAVRNQTGELGLNAQTSLARLHFAKGDKALAENIVAAILKRDPANPDALFVHANMAADKGFNQEAISDLRLLLHNHPQDREALRLLAEILLLQGFSDLAVDTLNQLVDVAPTDYAARVRLAQMVNVNGNAKHAIELLNAVVQAAPEYSVGWESLARIAISAKDFALAQAAIAKLNALPGQPMTALFLKGQIAALAHRQVEAGSSFMRVINASPSSTLASHALLALAEISKTPEQLQSAIRFITSLKTTNPVAYTVLGLCYQKLGNPALAASAFDTAIEEKAAEQDPYLERARLYLDNHQPAQALSLLKNAHDASPADIRAPLMEAALLNDLNRHDEAIALYETLLAQNPALDVAANNMAAIITQYAYADPVMLQKAQHAAERFIGSSNLSYLDSLAWVYYRQGKFDEALAVMERAVAPQSSLSPEIHYHYGAILWKAGKPEEAKAQLRQAVAPGTTYPGFDDAGAILRRL